MFTEAPEGDCNAARTHIASENVPSSRITASVVAAIVAVKGLAACAEIATAYGGAVRKSAALNKSWSSVSVISEAVERASKLKLDEARTHWARKIEGELEDRTQWAMALKQEKRPPWPISRGVAEVK